MQDKISLFAWSKTLLSVYRYLETITAAIDNLVLKHGINSGFFYSSYFNSTYNCANRIIELTARKQKLINVKIIVDDAISKLQNEDIRILALTYFDMVKSSEAAECLNISNRTFFRKKSIAIKKMGNVIKSFGFNADKLNEYLKDEQWLISLYNKNLNEINLKTKKTSESDKLSEYKLLKYIIKDYNKTTKKNFNYNNHMFTTQGR